MSALTPIGGAESQDGEGQSQSGQGQGEQGARATRHALQHGHTGERGDRGRLEREEKVRQRGGRRGILHVEMRQNGTAGMTKGTDGAGRVGQMLWDGFKR